MKLNWKAVWWAMILPLLLVVGSGCSGINASGGVSPATFFLPGMGQTRPDQPRLAPAPVTLEAARYAAQSH
ncbi:MAG: hypothetical protein HY674_04385 [Chloroflexi bacterium]|nr:hypothetical protein [Chloroflexota bacterium]